MYLKEYFSWVTKDSKSITKYLHGIMSLSNELSIISSLLGNDNLVIHTLNGVGVKYQKVFAALGTSENPISFEELHVFLSNFESYLKMDDSWQDVYTIVATHTTQKSK